MWSRYKELYTLTPVSSSQLSLIYSIGCCGTISSDSLAEDILAQSLADNTGTMMDFVYG